MAKVQIKSEKITPFGGIFHVRELFSRFAGPVIDKVLSLRCTSYGYQYSEIVGSLSSVYFCGGDCVEDVTRHLMPHLSLHPTLRTCSSDTILRGISALATANTTYTSDTGKSYDFNTAAELNSLLVKVLMNTGQLVAGESYDLDFDHQFIETEKYDAKMTYKKFTGYSPGVAVIGDLIVGIENRDGNANVRFHQQDTLERIFSNPPRHTEGTPHEWGAGPVGRGIHIPLHPDQRLYVHCEGNRRILQPQGRQGTNLRRYEQRIRMGQAAEVVHGREHRVPAADGTHTQLLQVHHGQA